TDDDHEISRRNTITMLNDPEEVTVKFYSPNVLHFPGDATYPDIQAAINAANNRDIIQIQATSQDEPYLTDGYSVSGKAVTITSVHPDDPCNVVDTVIEPEGGWIGRAFTFSNLGKDTLLNGITMRSFNRHVIPSDDGGEIPDDPILTYDGYPGGHIFGGIIAFNTASPSIKNCRLLDTTIIGGDGGAGQGGSQEHPDGGHGGWPGKAWGGAVALLSGSSPEFTNCRFEGCIARGGNAGDGGESDIQGGRGGGWYYSSPPPTPYEYPWSNFERYTNYTGMGGAVYVGSGSMPTFTACTFKDCNSIGGRCGVFGRIRETGFVDYPEHQYQIDNFGGAIYVADHGGVILRDCLFQDNTADPCRPSIAVDGYASPKPYTSQGGAIAAENAAYIEIDNCTFADNNGINGGAIYWINSPVQISDSQFIDNKAYNGGAVMMAATDDSKIARSTFENNRTNWNYGIGGAICGLGSNFMVVDSVINENFSGGGIYISSKDIFGDDITQENYVFIKNCLITNNVAGNAGGGISANWHAEPNIVNCTIVDNQVLRGESFGGGLACSYQNYSKVSNSIIYDNFAAKGAQIGLGTGFEYDPRPAVLNISYSLVGPEFANYAPVKPLDQCKVPPCPTVIDEQEITSQFGQGSGMARVIVSLKEPQQLLDNLDWSSPDSVDEYRQEVAYRQVSILSMLSSSEFELTNQYKNIAAFAGRISQAGFNKLKNNFNVAFIEPVRILTSQLKQGIPLIKAENVRPYYGGQGMAIAICDTGVDYTHIYLGGGGFPNAKVIGGYDFAMNDADPAPNGQTLGTAHGTACAGIAAGDEGTVEDYIGGVAPDARIVALKISSDDNDLGFTDVITASWDWCITNQKLVDPENPIMVISTSYGGGKFTSAESADNTYLALSRVAERCLENGITILASSGNDGFIDGLSAPAALSSVISVGAVYDTTDPVMGYSEDKVTGYSNTADFLDILAPAHDAYTTDIVGLPGYTIGDYFPYFGGTSAACPYGAGAVASLQSAAKITTGEFMEPEQVRAVLTSTGDPIADSKVAITKPRINLESAMGHFESGPIFIDEGSSIQNDWWDAENLTWDPCSHNLDIHDDPNFVEGQDGIYYLSQILSGQTIDSPCVDAGLGDAHDQDMYRHTTRTDRVLDMGIVDIGYHYLLSTDFIGDFNFDGTVDNEDLAGFYIHWLDKNCTFPYWCHERDLNFDGKVDNYDYAIWAAQFGEMEENPPEPDPMAWEKVPTSQGYGPNGYIEMTATQAIDDYSGTRNEYYFDCVSDTNPNFDSGWTMERTFELSIQDGLQLEVDYGFTVKARDKNGNETQWATIEYEHVPTAAVDRTPPNPNPMTWVQMPFAVSSESIGMVATTATDAISGSNVQYYFECTGGGGNDSGWQASPSYTDTGLTPNTAYGYRVRARDASENATQWSQVGFAITNPPPPIDPNICLDIFDPSLPLNPECTSEQYYDSGNGCWVHSVSGSVYEDPGADPAAIVYFRFFCLDEPGFSSPWLNSQGDATIIQNSDGTQSTVTYGGLITYQRIVNCGFYADRQYNWRLEASYEPDGGDPADRGYSDVITIFDR
ncbi:MAG: S8 family serine peptidase, partial [Planctomycetota bacterium]